MKIVESETLHALVQKLCRDWMKQSASVSVVYAETRDESARRAADVKEAQAYGAYFAASRIFTGDFDANGFTAVKGGSK